MLKDWLLPWRWFQRRHFITEFQRYTLTIRLMKVRLARKTYAYELDLLQRDRFSWKEVGTIRLQDVTHLKRLFIDLDNHPAVLACAERLRDRLMALLAWARETGRM